MPCCLHVTRIPQFPDYLPAIRPLHANRLDPFSSLSSAIDSIDDDLVHQRLSLLQLAADYSIRIRSIVQPFYLMHAKPNDNFQAGNLEQCTPKQAREVIELFETRKSAFANDTIELSKWLVRIDRCLQEQMEVLKALCRYQGLDEVADSHAIRILDRNWTVIGDTLVGQRYAKSEHKKMIVGMGLLAGWSIGGADSLTVGSRYDEWMQRILGDDDLVDLASALITRDTLENWALANPGKVGVIKTSWTLGEAMAVEAMKP